MNPLTEPTPRPADSGPAAVSEPAVRSGGAVLPGRFALAPLSELTGWPFRLLAEEFGAEWTCAPMVKDRFVTRRDPETWRELELHPEERRCGAQLCGREPDELAAAGRALIAAGFLFVEINAACPIRRLVAAGLGGGLLREPRRVEELTRTVARALAPAPVSVKLRAGIDSPGITAVECALAAQAGGAAWIVLHPRTVRQAYGGRADHALTARVRAALRIPLVASGDLWTAADGVRLLRAGVCSAVSFARGALGNPWIFRQAAALCSAAPDDSQPQLRPPSEAEVYAVFLRQAEWLALQWGSEMGARRARKLAGFYARRLPRGGAVFHARLRRARNLDELRRSVAACAVEEEADKLSELPERA